MSSHHSAISPFSPKTAPLSLVVKTALRGIFMDARNSQIRSGRTPTTYRLDLASSSQAALKPCEVSGNHQPRPCAQHGIRCLRFAQRRVLHHDVLSFLFSEFALRLPSPPLIGSPAIHGQLRSQSGQVAFGTQSQ
jgi:hypothetical protein